MLPRKRKPGLRHGAAPSHGAVASSGNHARREEGRRRTERPEKIKRGQRSQGTEQADDPEDAEIARLERLLGIKGAGASRKRAKLDKELAEEDGFDPDFVKFLHSLDDDQDSGAGSGSGSGLEGNENSESEELSDIDDHDVDDAEDVGGLLAIQEEEEEKVDDSDAGDEDFPGSVKHDGRADCYRPAAGEDIYGRVVDPAMATKAPAKYVPPHLRKAAAVAGAAEKGVAEAGFGGTAAGDAAAKQLQRAVTGLVNRLSEDTFDPVARALGNLYRTHSTTEVNEAVMGATLAVCVHDKQVMTSLIPAYATLLTGLGAMMGKEVGAFFLEGVARRLDDSFTAPSKATAADTDASGDGGGGGGRSNGSSGDAWNSDGNSGSGTASSGNGGGSDRARAANLLLLFGYMYMAGMVHCTVVWGLVRVMARRLGESDVECLALLLAHCGAQLRADDPASLREIGKAVEATASERARGGGGVSSGNGGGDGSGGVSGGNDGGDGSGGTVGDGGGSRTAAAANNGGYNRRVRFMLDELAALTGNKKRQVQKHEQQRERTRRFRKWVAQAASYSSASGSAGAKFRGSHGAHLSLQIPWHDLVGPNHCGRWWRVGAAWAGSTGVGGGTSSISGHADNSAAAAAAAGPVKSTAAAAGKDAGEDSHLGTGPAAAAGEAAVATGQGGRQRQPAELAKLAVVLRLNTDVRRAVLVALMGASDFEDAFERLVRLDLRGEQEREVARVLLACCGAESTYNPFYGHVAARFCEYQPKHRFTLQLAFWDAWKSLEGQPPRRAANLAQLLAQLLLSGRALSLSVLRAVDAPRLGPAGLLFFRLLFRHVFAEPDDAKFMAVFERLGGSPVAAAGGGRKGANSDTATAASETAVALLRSQAATAPRDWPAERRKHYKKRLKAAVRVLDSISTAAEFA